MEWREVLHGRVRRHERYLKLILHVRGYDAGELVKQDNESDSTTNMVIERS